MKELFDKIMTAQLSSLLVPASGVPIYTLDWGQGAKPWLRAFTWLK